VFYYLWSALLCHIPGRHHNGERGRELRFHREDCLSIRSRDDIGEFIGGDGTGQQVAGLCMNAATSV
jgi:hypothetical protein